MSTPQEEWERLTEGLSLNPPCAKCGRPILPEDRATATVTWDWDPDQALWVAREPSHGKCPEVGEFLILSKSRSRTLVTWWLPGGHGYTTDVDRAGRFSAQESARIVRGSPEKDARVPVALLPRLTTRRVVYLDETAEEMRCWFEELGPR